MIFCIIILKLILMKYFYALIWMHLYWLMSGIIVIWCNYGTVKMMGVKMGQAKMASYKIAFWKLSILPWKYFYILPKTKTNLTNHFSNVMMYLILLDRKSWFRVFKMIFCSIKINTTQFSTDIFVWLLKTNK